MSTMGCFAKQRSSSVPRSSTTGHCRTRVASRDTFSLLSNKPVQLPDPDQLLRGRHELGAPKTCFAKRGSFSGPQINGQSQYEVVTPGNSDVEGSGLRTLRRATSFGGRPQPLPRPIVAQDISNVSDHKQVQVYHLPLAVKVDASAGRVTPVTGGLPLPPPSLATKLLQPSLAAIEYRHLVLATDSFAASNCVSKSAFGDVFRAWIEDSSRAAATPRAKVEVAVFRLPENTQQGATEWKSEVMLLAQISHPNVCGVKGYCANEACSRLNSSLARRRQERLLVFEQPSNGSLHDHLFGSPRTSLDWNTRIDIALGTARGLMYIHDRAPLQIVFHELTASTVLLDNDYAPKLAGYGLSVVVPLVHRSSSFTTSMMLSQSQATVNVRSFGILLLELLTGKNSRDAIYFGNDANFVQWGRHFMKDELRLAQIIDPRMNGACPSKGAMAIVNLLLRCVSRREAQRSSLSEIVATLKSIKAKHCSSNKFLEAASHKVIMDNLLMSSSEANSSSDNDDVAMSKRPPRTHAFTWV